MATRFLRYDSDPILRKKCKAVLKVDDKIRQLLDDMLDTLHETENGAALAANQVGVLNEYGEEIIVDGEDEMAKCFCHELEHLDGMIFLDKAIEELSAL